MSSSTTTKVTFTTARPKGPSHLLNGPHQALQLMRVSVATASVSKGPGGGGFAAYNNHNSPQKLYCYGCNQTKTRLAFTISQLNKMIATKGAGRRTTASGGSGKTAHRPLCKSCTPDVVTTLKCQKCARTWLLEMFSKTQRKRSGEGQSIYMECRQQLDREGVEKWWDDDEGLDDGDDGNDDYEEYAEEDVRKNEWPVEVEKDDPDWHNGKLEDMVL
ncbi:hypothetical protein BGX29_006888 [Mortierella sp. GBA35]|nr:hypothetical protein BGX29_006888 [Mortierella sp. GBA35]